MRNRRTKRMFKDLGKSFSSLLASYHDVRPDEQISLADAFFLRRLLLERNPHEENELPAVVDSRLPYREFLRGIITSEEFGKQPGFPPPGHIWLAELERFRFWFNTTDREMGVRMAIGQYEPHSVEFVTNFVKPGMRCIDIGASTGFYTCLIASLTGPAGHVYAFEPRPSSLELLEKNVRENDYGDIVEIHKSACSDSAGELAGSQVTEMYITGEVPGFEKVTMKAVRVDGVVKEKVDFVKIDIEGYEPAGIQGMQSLIRDSRPVILTEINEYWLRAASGKGGKEYLNLLMSLGYQVFEVKDLDSPLDPETIEFGVLDIIDVVAIPKP